MVAKQSLGLKVTKYYDIVLNLTLKKAIKIIKP